MLIETIDAELRLMVGAKCPRKTDAHRVRTNGQRAKQFKQVFHKQVFPTQTGVSQHVLMAAAATTRAKPSAIVATTFFSQCLEACQRQSPKTRVDL